MQNSLQISACKAGYCGGVKINGLQAIALVGVLIAGTAIYINYRNNLQKQLYLQGQ